MPIGYDQDINLRISTKTEGGAEVGALASQFDALADASNKVKLLEGAEVRTKELSSEIERARQRVQSLQTALSEALNAGGDSKLIRGLSSQLTQAEREAQRLDQAFEKNGLSLAKLRMAAREAGVDVSKLAAEGFRLEKTAQSISAVQGAFNTLNVRSAAKIESEINAINQALRELASRSNVSGEEFDRAFAAAQVRLAKLKAELKGTPEEIDRIGQKAGSALGLMSRLAVSFSGIELARQFVMVNVELENIERSFTAITGSVARATAEMDYARGVANRLGLEQLSTAKSYASLMASTKGTSVEGEKSRQVFESVARAMSLAGKSTADTEGAMLALQQIAGKGVVQMEELRGQLGERLPGALNAAAEGFGITTAQLFKLTETGTMTAEELFPALTAGLNKLYKDAGAETLTQDFEHLKNSIKDVMKEIGDAGPIKFLKGAIESLESAIVNTSVQFGALTKKTGLFFEAIKSGELGLTGFSDRVNQAFADIEKEAQAKLLKVAEHNDVMARAMGEAGRAARESAKQHGEAVSSTTSEWTKLNLGFSLLSETTAKATEQQKKVVEATKAEGEAAIAAANAIGGEADKRSAATQAALANTQALERLAALRKDESAVADEQLLRLQQVAEANGGATEQQQKVIDALIRTAEARKADAQTAAAQADSARLAAVATKIEAAAYEAAQGKIGEWNEAKRAQLTVDQAVIRLAIEQQQTVLQVARARGDEYTATQAVLSIKRLEIQLAELTAKAKRAEAEAALEVVKAKRAELEAAGQLTTAKDLELKAQEAGAKVKQIEGKIAEETAGRMRKLADAYQQSGRSAGDAAHGISSIGDAAERSVPGVDNLTNSLTRMNSARMGGAPSAGSLLQGPQLTTSAPQNAQGQHVDSRGNVFTDRYGKPVTDSTPLIDQGSGTRMGGQIDFVKEMYRNGASIEEAKIAQKYVSELYTRNSMTMLTGNLGNETNAARQSNYAIKNAVQKSLEYARQEMQTGQSVDLGPSAMSILARNQAQTDMRKTHDWEFGLKKQIAMNKSAGNEAIGATKLIRVQFDNGRGQRAELMATDERQVNDFLRVLEDAKARSSS